MPHLHVKHALRQTHAHHSEDNFENRVVGQQKPAICVQVDSTRLVALGPGMDDVQGVINPGTIITLVGGFDN